MEALRSGKYEQTKGHYGHRKPDGTMAACAIGVLLYESYKVRGRPDALAMPHRLKKMVADMNDSGSTFEEIANFLEREVDNDPLWYVY